MSPAPTRRLRGPGWLRRSCGPLQCWAAAIPCGRPRPAGEPLRSVSFFGKRPRRRQLACSTRFAPRLAQPWLSGGGEARAGREHAGREELELVRGEVDDQELAARLQHPRRLRMAGPIVRKCSTWCMTTASAAPSGSARLSISPWRTGCPSRPPTASRARRRASPWLVSIPMPRSIAVVEQLQHPAGTGAEIEKQIDRLQARGPRRSPPRRRLATCSARMWSHSAAWAK